MPRQQLPSGITKVDITNRRTGKSEPRWRVKLNLTDTVGERHQVNRSFETEREARDFHAETLGAVQAGVYVRPSKRTMRQACDDWIASKHKLKTSTREGYKIPLKVITDAFGPMRVQQLTKRDVDDLVTALRAGHVDGRTGYSARSTNTVLMVLGQVLKSEQAQGHVVRNVASLVDRITVDDAPEFRTLTESEILMILDHECRERHLWTLALYGMRRGEIAGLRWDHVDLKAGTVTIVETRPGKGKTVDTPKSRKSRRTLPLSADVVAVLKAARKQQRREQLALGDAYQPSGYVACDEAGHRYPAYWLSRAWDRAQADLKIERVRLHDARHSCGTLMHMRGVPIAVISAWLGHANTSFTMNTYVHSQDDALKAAGESFR